MTSTAGLRGVSARFLRKNRIAFVCAFVLFIVLAGTGTAAALWNTSASLTASAGIATAAGNCSPNYLKNGSFETPLVSGVTTKAVEPWTTTDPAGIEVWPDNTGGVRSALGSQFIELNASRPGTISQVISTTPGETLQWSLLHRGREGRDTMDVVIGTSVATAVLQATIADSNVSWVRSSGAYVVPAGQTSTTFGLKSVSTASTQNSLGNLVDGVSFGSGSCLSSVSTVTNTSNGGGAVRAGDVLEYVTTVTNTGGAPAIAAVLTETLPASLTPNSSSFVMTGGGSAAISSTSTLSARMGYGATTTAGGVIDPGVTVGFRFLATVGSSAGGTSIEYSPSVAYADQLTPAWPLGVSPAALTTPVVFGADVVAGASVVRSALPGGRGTFAFAISNNGPLTATALRVNVTFPRTFSPESTTQSGIMPAANCTRTDTTTTFEFACLIGDYAAGASGVMNVTGTVSGAQNSPITAKLVATATSTDPNSANNTSSTTMTTLESTPPLQVVQTTATGTTPTTTTLNWKPGSDNVGVVSYNVYSGTGGAVIATSTSTSVTLTGLAPGTTTTYSIKAVDASGNLSVDYSNVVSVTTPLAPISTSAVYTITKKPMWSSETLCLDASGSGRSEGTAVTQYPCNGGSNQRWQFVATSTADYYTVHPLYTSSLSWSVKTQWVGASVQLLNTKTSASSEQIWKRVSVGGGMVQFQNGHGMCLTVPGDNSTHALQLQQADCSNTNDQFFTMTAAN